MVAEAYEIVQREKCGQCGLPKWMCQNDSNNIQFKIKRDSCAAIQKKAAYEKQHEKDKDKDGVSIRPEPYTVDGRDLVEHREPYYKAIMERNKDPE